jgi:hypothetical protein
MPLTGLVADVKRRRLATEQKTEQIKPVQIKQEVTQIKQEVKRTLDFSSEIEQAAKTPQLQWQECRHLKTAGERKFCKRYFSLCAQGKCSSKLINAEENEFDFKKILSRR